MRRAFLAGDRLEHRKVWLEERLQFLARCFAAEVAGYAVLANHVHVIVRLDRAVAVGRSEVDVARRWLSIYSRRYLSDDKPVMPSEIKIGAKARMGQ